MRDLDDGGGCGGWLMLMLKGEKKNEVGNVVSSLYKCQLTCDALIKLMIYMIWQWWWRRFQKKDNQNRLTTTLYIFIFLFLFPPFIYPLLSPLSLLSSRLVWPGYGLDPSLFLLSFSSWLAIKTAHSLRKDDPPLLEWLLHFCLSLVQVRESSISGLFW